MDIKNVITALDGLAQENRLAIFRLLTEISPNGMRVGAIGEKLGLPATTLLFHLDKLKQADLVRNRREGRANIYSANTHTLIETLQYLTENCCKDSGADGCRIVINSEQQGD
jgi:DNA-binding transcriptional ArsR family regulator